jgi:hypothetical protein
MEGSRRGTWAKVRSGELEKLKEKEAEFFNRFYCHKGRW